MALCTQTIVITESNHRQLRKLLDAAEAQGVERADSLKALGKELRRARVVRAADMPPDAITMNSTVRLRDLDTGEAETLTLVYPGDANAFEDRISVLAPVGTAILGFREGDVIEWPVPSRLRRLQVEAVLYQPERAGVHDL